MDYADIVRADEMARSRQWLSEMLATLAQGDADGPGPFIDFTYDGRPAAQLLRSWPVTQEDLGAGDGARNRRLTWQDPNTSLQVTLDVKEYTEFPVVEWVAHFENTGPAATPILENVQGLDVSFKCPQDPLLHYNHGDDCSLQTFEPYDLLLEKGSEYRFAPVGGRPTNGAWPYYNLHWGDQGCIVVLGWPGQWSTRFTRDDGSQVRARGGQELTHLKLLPGETIRTTLSVLLFYNGDALRAQNLWRRWMWAHNVPRNRGQLPAPQSAMCAGLAQDEAGEIAHIDTLESHGAHHTHWHMDAGWYGERGPWWRVGTWRPDPERFPHGVKAVADHAHAHGMKLTLWFEIERVSQGMEWCDHPEWLLALPADRRQLVTVPFADGPRFITQAMAANMPIEGDRLYNLGNPAAWQRLVDHLSQCIGDWGVDTYRLDHNFAPLAYWRANDAPDRQGSTENHYVTGWIAVWDELRRRHPDLVCDSCAGGGRRLDLEALRRCIVLTRSDYWCRDPEADQTQTLGVSSWMPYYLTACPHYEDEYWFHSNLSICLGLDYPHAPGDTVDWPLFRERLAAWRRVAPFFYGDYYPLTSWSEARDALLAWQFDRPDMGQGIVQAFCRSTCPVEAARFRLQGLTADATYRLADLEGRDQPAEFSGQELMEKGLRVSFDHPRQAVALVYQRV